jgi:uncharacterized protein (TIGR03083 family)
MTTATCSPVITPITRTESFAVAQVAIARELDLLRALTPQEWELPTACPAWTVRQVVVHQVAMAEAFLRPGEGIRQVRAGKRLEKAEGLPPLDAFMQGGQRPRDEWSAQQALTRFEDRALPFARRRARFPQPLRSVMRVPTNDGTIALGYLFDRVINRDLFMHRVDICDATGRELVLTPEHEGRLLADVVADWAAAHGQPFDLTLTGPAGGHWSRGTGGERIELDAVDFARVLSGRGTGSGLLATPVLF